MTQITACIDGSPGAIAVCDAAAWVSAQLQTPLTLLHVLEKAGQNGTDLSGSIGLGSREHLLQQLTELDAERARLAMEHSRIMLDAARERAQNNGAVEPKISQRHGRLSEEVLPLAEDSRVLVMGRQGMDHPDPAVATLGSQLETVLRSVACPVLITTGVSFRKPTRFMLAYDGSEAVERVIETYADSSLLNGVECHLVMVNHTGAEQVAKFEAAQARLEKSGFTVVPRQCEGDVLSILNDYQFRHQIDLIVMGAYGHSRIRQFFVGSHTRNMVSHSKVPLLLLR
ncbi:MAG: universal stress protein [Thalassolituus sp.]